MNEETNPSEEEIRKCEMSALDKIGAKGFSPKQWGDLNKFNSSDWEQFDAGWKKALDIAFVCPVSFFYWFLGCGVVAFLVTHNWLKTIFALFLVWILTEVVKRLSYHEAFKDGYLWGHEAGITKAMGLTEEEDSALHDFLHECEVNSRA